MIYIDMDGVVADFDAAVFSIFGEEYSEKFADEFWEKTCVENEVFRRMPVIPQGIAMVEAIRAQLPICFATSTGGLPHHIDIAKQKLDWLHRHGLGRHPVVFCMNTVGKAAHAYRGALLIDDREKVCDVWRMRGGTARLFTRKNASEIADEVLSLKVHFDG